MFFTRLKLNKSDKNKKIIRRLIKLNEVISFVKYILYYVGPINIIILD